MDLDRLKKLAGNDYLTNKKSKKEKTKVKEDTEVPISDAPITQAVIAVTPASSMEIQCPFCNDSVLKPDFYDHMVDTHNEKMTSNEEKKEPAPEQTTNTEVPCNSVDPECGMGKDGGITMTVEGKKVTPLKIDDNNIGVETWFERDRKHVEIHDKRNDKTILQFWDEAVDQAVEDGFLDPRDWRESMIDYAKHLGLIKEEVENVVTPMDTAKDEPVMIKRSEVIEPSENEKIKVPDDIKKQLKSVIAGLVRNFEMYKNRDQDKATFNKVASDCLLLILSNLEEETVIGMKKAQLEISKAMGPIVNLIPDSVIKFVACGGVKPSLKDRFSDIRNKK